MSGSALYETFARAPLSFDRGEGSWLITEDGERYLDFAGGIAVNSLGHGHPKLVAALGEARDPSRAPLNVLLQVNIDAEAGKHGCAADDVPALAALVAAQPRLSLRGLMAIPAPFPESERRRDSFRRMRALFDALHAQHPHADTLSMGMSADAGLAIAEGATMVRIGTALFGPRKHAP